MIRFGLAKNPSVTSVSCFGPSNPIVLSHFAAQFVMQIWSLDPPAPGWMKVSLTVDGTKVSVTFVARNKTTRSIQYTQYTYVYTAQVMAFHHVCFMGLLFFSLPPWWFQLDGMPQADWRCSKFGTPIFIGSFRRKLRQNFTNMESLKSGKLPTSNKFFYQSNKTTLPGPTMVVYHAMARSASISCITLRMVDTSWSLLKQWLFYIFLLKQ